MAHLEITFKNDTYLKIKTKDFPEVGSIFKAEDIFYKDKYKRLLDCISIAEGTKTVLLALFNLLHRQEWVRVQHQELAEMTGLPLSTLRYHMKVLQDNLFIDKKAPRKEVGKITAKTNKYCLLWHQYYRNIIGISSIKKVDRPTKSSSDKLRDALTLLKDQYHPERKDLQPFIAAREFKKMVVGYIRDKKKDKIEVSFDEAITKVSTKIYKYLKYLKTQSIWTREGGKYLLGFGNLLLSRLWEEKEQNLALGVEEHRASQIDALNEMI